MASLKFDTYQIGTNGATHVGSIEWDPDVDNAATVVQRTNKVLEALKRKDWIVAPNGEEAAWIIGQPKKGGRRIVIAPEVVRDVHKLYVTDGEPIKRIPFLIYAAHKDADGEGLELKDNVISGILRQERGTEVDGIDDLRAAAKAKLGPAGKGAKKKYTDADRDEWQRLHLEENMSGSAIGNKFGINSSIVNTELRKRGVQQNSRGTANKVNTA